MEYHIDQTRTHSSVFIQVITILLILRSSFGVITYSNIFNSTLYLLIYIIWFVLISLNRPNYLSKVLRLSYPIIIFLLLNISIDILSIGYITKSILNYVNIFINFTILIFCIDQKNKKMIGLSVLLLSMNYLIIIVNTLIQLSIDYKLSRLISTAQGISSVNYSGDLSLIADFGFVYAVLVLLVFFFSVYSKTNRIIILLIVAFVGYFIFSTSFFFAIIIEGFIIGLILLKRVFKQKYIYSLVLLIIILLLILLRRHIGEILIEFAQSQTANDIISGKINDFGVLFINGIDSAFMSNLRLELYLDSLKTFIMYPLFGVHGLHTTNSGIGQHSAWVDGLAMFGFVRYIPYLLQLYIIIGYSKKLIYKEYSSIIFLPYLAFIIIGVFNPNVFPQMWNVLILYIPLSIVVLRNFIAGENK